MDHLADLLRIMMEFLPHKLAGDVDVSVCFCAWLK